MPTLYHQRIFCETEMSVLASPENPEPYWVSKWTDSPALITSCPNDPSHTVTPGSASILETMGDGTVYISKEKDMKTKEHIRVESYALEAAPGTTGTVTKTWDIPISIYTVRLAVPTPAVGCLFTATVGHETMGVIGAGGAVAGATTFPVLSPVMNKIDLGYVITLVDGDRTEDLGHVTAVGPATLTTHRAPSADFPAGALVRVGVRPCKDLELAIGESYLIFGDDRGKAMPVEPGIEVVCTLQNPTANPARCVIYAHFGY